MIMKTGTAKKPRYTMHMHTGQVVKSRVTYDSGYFPHGQYKTYTNWQGERTKSCCGCFELQNIKGQFSYENIQWGELTTVAQKREAFHNFLKDVAVQHGGIIMYLVEPQETGEIGNLVRHFKFEALPKFYNPKTTRTLYPYYKCLKAVAPGRKGKSTLNARFNDA